MLQAVHVTTVMKSLADPTRRALFETIASRGEATVSALVKGSHVSQPAISQHLRALRDAGLVSEEKKGRQVFYRPKPEGLAPLVNWVGFYSQFWRERLEAMEKLLKEMDE
jgi:DNA-binding transcriptional ArsR family regulator